MYQDHVMASRCIDVAHIGNIQHMAHAEEEIIAINDALLSPGLHEVFVQDAPLGKELISILVALLNCYDHIYWLSHNHAPVGMIDLMKDFERNNCYTNLEAMQDYLYSQFTPDLLIIEMNHEFGQKKWFIDFMHYIKCYAQSQMIPVMLLQVKK